MALVAGVWPHPGRQNDRERERSVQAEHERVRARGQQEPRRNHQRAVRHEDGRNFPRRSHDAAILVHYGSAQPRHGVHRHIIAEPTRTYIVLPPCVVPAPLRRSVD